MDNTVFVIGAGASTDFGLPVGSKLIDQIATSLVDSNATENHSLLEAITSLAGNDGDEFDKYQAAAGLISRALWISESIDNFIGEQNNPYVTAVGKLAIVFSILRAEDSRPAMKEIYGPDRTWSRLAELHQSKPTLSTVGNNWQVGKLDFPKLRKTWLVPFFKEIRGQTTLHNLGSRFEKIKMIIFNYDRCVEQFLFYALRTYDDLTDEKTAEFLSKIDFIHPYGVVGKLPWQADYSLDSPNLIVEYGGPNSVAATILSLKDEIRTFTEVDETDPQQKHSVESMKKMIDVSRTLVFLGFGYHPANMKRLGKGSNFDSARKAQRRLFATAYRAEEYHVGEITKSLKCFAGRPTPSVSESFEIETGNCSDLLKKYSGQIIRREV